MPRPHGLTCRLGLALIVMAVIAVGCGRGGSGDGATTNQVRAEAGALIAQLDGHLAAGEERLLAAEEAALVRAADGDLGTMTAGALLVGTNADFPPFVDDVDGGLTGFDIELFDAIATRMGLVVTYTDMGFTELTGAMTAGEIDVIVAAMTITEERDEVLDFTVPYFVASQALLVPEGSPVRSLEDLSASSTLLVLADTTGEQFAADVLPEVPTVSVAQRQGAVSRLSGGLADALLMDFLSAREEAEKNPGLALVEEIATGERYGYGVPEGHVALQLALDEALASVIADGTYAEIFRRWFPDRDVEQALNVLQ